VVGRNVVFLGLTSLLSDVSSEMVRAVLPLYLTVALGFSAFQFGLVDGLYEGATALMRLAGGRVADRGGRYKQVAAVGYGVSALSRVGLLAAGALWLPITACVLLDRLAKGLRTPPRDALLALSAPPGRLAEAFGVHRAMDAGGALLGPLVAFAVLAWAPGAYDAVFIASFAFGIAGVGALWLLVENRVGAPGGGATRPGAWRETFGLLRVAPFRALVAVGGLLGLATISDAFIYLLCQRRAALDPIYFPLLPLAVSAVYLLLAIPAGRLADAVGRTPGFLAGYALLAAAYLPMLLASAGGVVVLVSLPLLGAYYAATDGVLMALATRTLPGELLTTGIGLLTAISGMARLVAAMVFGALWSGWGPELAVRVFLAALLATLLVSPLVLRWRQR
jgi:MFS family permease